MAGSSNDAAERKDVPEGLTVDGEASQTILTSGVRPKSTRSETSARSRLILFATPDEESVCAFERSMPEGVRVLRMDDVFSLLGSLGGSSVDDPTVIIDGRPSMFRAETIAALSSALPEKAQVLLWGIDEESLRALESLATRPFVRAGSDATIEDLAWMCRPRTVSDAPPAPRAARRILILDDDDAYARSVARLLRTAGYEVLVEHDARTALDVCRDEEPEAALVDLHMPGMNGVSFASVLRLALGDEAPKIIMVTGTSAPDLDDSLFDGILHKPVGPTKLLTVVHSLLPIED